MNGVVCFVCYANEKLWIENGFITINKVFNGHWIHVMNQEFNRNKMTINTETGTADYINVLGAPVSDPSLVIGDPFLTVNPGYTGMALAVQTGAGTATVCWRPAVVSA